MTHEEIKALKDEIFADADNRYVAIDICNEKQEKVNSKFASDDKRIGLISHDLGGIKKFLWAIATASIGSLVAEVISLLK